MRRLYGTDFISPSLIMGHPFHAFCLAPHPGPFPPLPGSQPLLPLHKAREDGAGTCLSCQSGPRGDLAQKDCSPGKKYRVDCRRELFLFPFFFNVQEEGGIWQLLGSLLAASPTSLPGCWRQSKSEDGGVCEGAGGPARRTGPSDSLERLAVRQCR